MVCLYVLDTNYVLSSYKTEPCKKPPRLCRQGYACPHYHNTRDRRRSPRKFRYRLVCQSYIGQNRPSRSVCLQTEFKTLVTYQSIIHSNCYAPFSEWLVFIVGKFLELTIQNGTFHKFYSRTNVTSHISWQIENFITNHPSLVHSELLICIMPEVTSLCSALCSTVINKCHCYCLPDTTFGS